MLTFIDITVLPGVTSVILLNALHFSLCTSYFVFWYIDSILFAFIFCNDLETKLSALSYVSGDKIMK